MYITGCLVYGYFGRSWRICVNAWNILHGVLVQVAVPCTVSSLGTGIYKHMHVLTNATIRRDSVAQLLVQHIVFTKFIVFIRYYSGGVGGVFL